MKKVLVSLLALMLILSCCPVSLAIDYPDLDTVTGPIEYPTLGLSFDAPEVYRNTDGVVCMEGPGEYSKLVEFVSCSYYAMTAERYAEYTSSHELTIPADELWIDMLFEVFVIRKGMTFEEFNTYSGHIFYDSEVEQIREIAKVGDTTYYLYMPGPNPDFLADVDPVWLDEYVAMASASEEVIAGLSFYEATEAEDPFAGLVGTKIEFTTVDLDGNPVSSADIFAQAEVTMLNYWASWCAPCIGEFEDLQSIHTHKENVQVVGVLIDDDLDTAREHLDEFNVTYLNIREAENQNDFFTIKNMPTTVFVGPDGTILAEPVVGAMVERYHTILNALSREAGGKRSK